MRQLQKAYLDKSRELISTEITYITDHLDFATLYYSPIYADYLVSWLSSYNFVATSVADFEQRLSADAVGTISRLMMSDQTKIAENVAKDLAIFAYRYGFAATTRHIVEYMRRIDKKFVSRHTDLKYIVDKDLANTPKQAAHKIVGLDSKLLANCLIIFFDSGSKRSTDEVDKIIDKYGSLQQKGLRVISIASDTDLEQYNEFAKRLPWADKLCDQYGIKGENFENYGVFDTPAIFLTDKEGNIIRAGSDLDKVIQ